MLTSKPVPDTWIQTPDLKQKGIQLCIRREDLTHPVYGGNKLRKLKYHFEAFKNSQYTEVLSFGGAWSNHVFAISGACMELDIRRRFVRNAYYGPCAMYFFFNLNKDSTDK